MPTGPSRGLPPRIYVPIIVVFAALFLTVVGSFVRAGLGVTGSAIGPDAAATAPHQGDADLRDDANGGEVTVPQSGGAEAPAGGVDPAIGGGGPANLGPAQGGTAAGGPPPPVQRLLTEYRDRLQRDPRDLTALTGIAELETDAGMFDRALPYDLRALAVRPDDARIRTDYAAALHGSGRDREALLQLRRVLDAAPRDPGTLFDDGTLASALGDRADAIRALRAFLAVAPRDPRADEARAELAKLGV